MALFSGCVEGMAAGESDGHGFELTVPSSSINASSWGQELTIPRSRITPSAPIRKPNGVIRTSYASAIEFVASSRKRKVEAVYLGKFAAGHLTPMANRQHRDITSTNL